MTNKAVNNSDREQEYKDFCNDLFSVCLYESVQNVPRVGFPLEHLYHSKVYSGYTGMNLGWSKNLFTKGSVYTTAAA